MYNRYVDGLGTWQPDNPAMYEQMGKRLASESCRRPASQSWSLSNPAVFLSIRRRFSPSGQ